MGAPVTPLWDQDSFQFFEDDAAPGSATSYTALNVNPTAWAASEGQLQLVFLVQETNGANKDPALPHKLQININSGGWNDITTSDTAKVYLAASTNITETHAITSAIIGAGTWFNGNAWDVTNGGSTGGLSVGNDETNVVFSIAIGSSAVDTDVIQFQLVETDSTVYNSYTRTPQVTLDIPAAAQDLTMVGLATAEAIGILSLTLGAIALNPTGVVTAETMGTPTLADGGLTVNPTGIVTAEAIGTPSFTFGAISINPTGLATEEAIGVASIIYGSIDLNLTGIVTAEAIGIPSVNVGALTATMTGLVTGEAIGIPTFTFSALPLNMTGLTTEEAIGIPTLQQGSQNLNVTGIITAEVMGIVTLNAGAVPLNLTGLISAEALGTPTLSSNNDLNLIGISSSEAIGRPVVGDAAPAKDGAAHIRPLWRDPFKPLFSKPV